MDLMIKIGIFLWLNVFMRRNVICMFFIYLAYLIVLDDRLHRRGKYPRRWSVISKIPDQIKCISELVELNDQTCNDNLRMDRNAFLRLCYLLENIGGLCSDRFVTVSEKVASFLLILSHHTKNRIVKRNFKRSGQIVCKYFRQTLRTVIKISGLLLVAPQPIGDDCITEPWRHFKGCLEALDGTYIEVRVRRADQARYMNRKGFTAVNFLGVCNCELKFVYVLSGWEGSAADSRVLRDALNRPHGLRVPTGGYYLCDAGYANCEGFFVPFRGSRYHLEEWRNSPNTPQNPREYFNMKHSKARNVIERAFGILKKRWAILRSAFFYPIKQQNFIILACTLLHNFIRTQMEYDPLEDIAPEGPTTHDGADAHFEAFFQSSTTWNMWRNRLTE